MSIINGIAYCTENRIIDSKFTEVIARLANFSNSKLRNVDFKESNLLGSYFQSDEFKSVDFDSCNLERANFWETKLNKIDFGNSNIDGIIVKIEDVRGLTVNPLQAVELSKIMGIIIK